MNYPRVYITLWKFKLNFPILIIKICIPSSHLIMHWTESPSKRYVEDLIPRTLECDLIWRQGLADVIRMRSHWSRVAPHPTWLASVQEDGNVKTQRKKATRLELYSCKPAIPKTASKPPGTRKRWRRIPLQISEGVWHSWHIEFGRLASRTVRLYISVVWSHPLYSLFKAILGNVYVYIPLKSLETILNDGMLSGSRVFSYLLE